MSDSFVLYRYDPSYAAAVIFTIGFLITGVGHIWQATRSGSRFMTPFIIGIACKPPSPSRNTGKSDQSSALTTK